MALSSGRFAGSRARNRGMSTRGYALYNINLQLAFPYVYVVYERNTSLCSLRIVRPDAPYDVTSDFDTFHDFECCAVCLRISLYSALLTFSNFEVSFCVSPFGSPAEDRSSGMHGCSMTFVWKPLGNSDQSPDLLALRRTR